MADFDPGLSQGQVLTNDKVRQIFKCSGVGSMRRSHGTNSLVLITGESAGPYRDRWQGEEFHFTGRGLRGDQDLGEVQNRTLAESDTNGVAIFHFDNPEGDRYVFTGKMKLAGKPYTEKQADEVGNQRQVWVFPLTAAKGAGGGGVQAGAKAAPRAAAKPVKKESKSWWERCIDRLRKLVKGA